MSLRVEGTRVLNARGEAVWLRGVNIASLEWTDEGHHVAQSLDHAIREWKVNFIRLPLAQDRWFGKMPSQSDRGAAYRGIVDRLVETSAAARVYLDLELHWSNRGIWSCDDGRLGQHVMPDCHSVTFWRDIATRYKNHPNVIFGLYNEPYDVSFAVWRDGGSVTEKPGRRERDQTPVTFEAVGMQQLYDTVRSVGAENVVSISGVDWGYDLRGLLDGYEVKGTNIIYETHPYRFKKDWDKNFGDVSRKYAVLLGEFGGGTNDLDYGRQLMDYARERGLHWAAWDFHTEAGPTLIRNWSYEPTVFGQFVKDTIAKTPVLMTAPLGAN